MSEPRKLHVKSYGCQMNAYDSQRMADLLAGRGYVETGIAEAAELVILNTCHIREKAAEKVYSDLGRMRKWKESAEAEGRRVKIVVAGCVAQAEGEEILRRAPLVDIVVGPQNYHRLPALLDRAERGDKLVDTEFAAESKFDALGPAPGAAIRRPGRYDRLRAVPPRENADGRTAGAPRHCHRPLRETPRARRARRAPGDADRANGRQAPGHAASRQLRPKGPPLRPPPAARG